MPELRAVSPEPESQVPMYLEGEFVGFCLEHQARKFIRSGQARPCRHRPNPDDAAYEMRIVLDPDSAAAKERLVYLKGCLPAPALQGSYSECVWNRVNEDSPIIVTGRVQVLKRLRHGCLVPWKGEAEGFRPGRYNEDRVPQPLFRTGRELALSPPLRAAGRNV